MKMAVNAIYATSTEIGGAVKTNNELRDSVKDLHVKFHGDFVLPYNPTTFEEVIKIFNNLPDFEVVEKTQSVPMRVYLYPLKKIDENKIFSIIRDINESLVNKLVIVMQDLEDALEEACQLDQSTVSEHFIVFKRKIGRFSNAVNQYKLRFQSLITPMLLEIRNREKEESELAYI